MTFTVEYDNGVAAAERAMEAKAVIGLGDALGEWANPGVSRQDGANFRTNMVTLAQYDDSSGSSSALGISAVWACVNLLAGTIASLPLMVYRTEAGVRQVAKDHGLYRILHDSPNADQSAVDFWEFMQASIELHGNAYAEKSTTGERVSSLRPVRPDIVSVSRGPRGLIYRWSDEGRSIERRADQMLHIHGFGGSPLGGVSTLSGCRGTFDAAQSVNTAARAIFRNGVRASGVMSIDKPLTKEQRDLAEALLQSKFAGSMNDGRPMLLDNGMKWEQLTINPGDAQMLESRRFAVEEICRVFGVPPHMIGHTENSTSWGTGLEQQTLGFQKFTLRRRLKRIEQALEKQLLTPADRAAGVTIEFNLEGLLRGDSASRASFYQQMLTNGVMTINEVRALENLPPVPGGDVPRMQMQNVPITEAGREEE